MRLFVCLMSILIKLGCFSEMIAALKKLESEPDYNQGLIKASTKQYKVFPKVDICLLVDGMLQKNSEDMYLDTVFLTYSDCCLKYIICVLICFPKI